MLLLLSHSHLLSPCPIFVIDLRIMINNYHIPVHYKAMVISEALMYLAIANTASTSRQFHLSINDKNLYVN